MKNNLKMIAILILSTTLSACGPSSQEHNALVSERNQLKQQVEQLKKQLDDIQHGADRLLKKSERLIQQDELKSAKTHLSKLIEKHPDSPEFKKGTALLQKVEAQLAAIEKQRKASAAKAKAKKKAEIARATRSLKKKHDEVRGVTWYTHTKAPTTSRGIYIYIGKSKHSDPWLRLVTRYKGEDWLFIQGYTLSIDGQNYYRENLKYERDNGYGQIWEWHDTTPTHQDLELIRKIADSKKTILRFQGRQYYHDYIVPAAEKRAIKETLIAYEALKNPT